MNLIANPELLDRLAAGHAVGTLRGGARRRFETLAREQAPVRAAALVWQSRLAGLTELQQPVTPNPAVWIRIENLLRAEREQRAMQAARSAPGADAPARQSWWHGLALWRGLSAAGALATVIAVVVAVNVKDQWGAEVRSLQARLQAVPEVKYVAVLADDQANASMLVTFDPKSNKLTLQRVGSYQEASDRSLQLWALPPKGGPRSLGVLGGDKVLRLTAAENDVREVPMLAISLEPKGGVPSEGGPTGPVVFKGVLIQKSL
jgi:anti-sigma-K factor RskA